MRLFPVSLTPALCYEDNRQVVVVTSAVSSASAAASLPGDPAAPPPSWLGGSRPPWKLQAPSDKSQTSSKRQAPNLKPPVRGPGSSFGIWGFGDWCLFVICDLELAIPASDARWRRHRLNCHDGQMSSAERRPKASAAARTAG